MFEFFVIFLLVLQFAFQIVIARLMVQLLESDAAKIKRFLQSKGLVDLPMAREGQKDYSNVLMQNPVSKDLRIIKDE